MKQRLLPLLLLALSHCHSPWSQAPYAEVPYSEPTQKTAQKAPSIFTIQTLQKNTTITPPAAPPMATTPLSDTEVSAMLSKLSALPTDDALPLSLRPASLPPPKTDAVVLVGFSPSTDAQKISEGKPEALSIIRTAPLGETNSDTEVTIVFSRAMTKLTTLSALAKEEVPASITPTPKGSWRWVSPKILRFTPDGPMPMATQFTVKIPAGTKSIYGEPLDKENTFSFSTPAAKITGSYPYDPDQRQDALVFFSFNQQVNPEKILAVTEAKHKTKALAIRLATPQEIASNPDIKKLYAKATPGTAVVFAPEKEWPYDAEIKLKVGPNIPSAEGDRTDANGQYLSFSTYGPMRYENSGASSYGFSFSFSNAIDSKSIDPKKISIEPKIKDPKISISAEFLDISAKLTPGFYTVTIPAGVSDIFGQSIDREIQMKLRVEKEKVYRSTSIDLSFYPGQITPEQAKYLPIYVSNIKEVQLNVYRVKIDDWNLNALDPFRKDPKKPLGEKLFGELVPIQRDASGNTSIDLSPALKSSGGVGQIVVELIDVNKKEKHRRVVNWMQVTNLSLDAYYDHGQLFAWVNKDASSVEGAEVSLRKMVPLARAAFTPKTAMTDESGVARLSAPNSRGSFLLQATKGDDSIFLTDLTEIAATKNRFLWYLTDGRDLYRPGEDIKIKGWLRYHKFGDDTAFQSVEKLTKSVYYYATDELGNELFKGETPLDENGGFSLQQKLPETVNLGYVTINFTAAGSFPNTDNVTQSQEISVQEYRRPEFEVTTSLDEGPFFFGDSFTVTTNANYFSGGGLPNAPLKWNISSSHNRYSPPGWSEYYFGPENDTPHTDQITTNDEYKTDADGQHFLQVSVFRNAGVYPITLTGGVTVQDVNRQSFYASFSTIVHPAAVYVGVKSEHPFEKLGQPFTVSSIATDIEGISVEGRPLTLSLSRVVWSEKEKKQTLLLVDSCEKISSKEKVVCTFSPKEQGLYQIDASIKDALGRESQSQLRRYVVSAGPNDCHPPASSARPGEPSSPSSSGKPEARPGDPSGPCLSLKPESLQLIANQTSYQPGDTAEVLLLTPFYPAQGILFVTYKDQRSANRFFVDGPSKILKIDIEKDSYPQISAQVELVGNTETDGVKTPTYASQTVVLSVPAKEKELTVEVTPAQKELSPGAETSVEIVLKDHTGAPVEGEAAIFVMDESLLALSGFTMPSPINVFYQWSYHQVSSTHSRDEFPLSDQYSTREFLDSSVFVPGSIIRTSNRYFADGLDIKDKVGDGKLLNRFKNWRQDVPDSDADGILDAQDSSPLFEMRSSFESSAFFEARVKTNAQGKVTVPFKLQDSLTRYRIMVVAASGVDRFGTGESTVTAKLPLTVRPSPPRFLLPGDKAEVSVVLQNQTDKPMKLNVALRASLSSLEKGKGYKIEIPGNDRREIRFPVTATEAGTMTIQTAANAGAITDAAEVKVPIYSPASTEDFALYGELDAGAVSQPIKIDGDVNPLFGGVSVTTSSTALSSLTDAFLYLVQYPYDCSEQRASRVLAILALKDFLQAFNAVTPTSSQILPSKEKIDAIIKADLSALEQLQTYSGGFGFFSKEETAWPYNSVHVTHALIQAKLAGYDVDQNVVNRAKNYLDRRGMKTLFSTKYSKDEIASVNAYAVYVLRLFGDKDSLAERGLTSKLDTLPIEALGWILPSLSMEDRAAVQKILLAKVSETAGAAHFENAYENGSYFLLSAERRADAIVLEALIETDPKNELIPKLVKGLNAHRTKGRWSSTQENAFVLLALKKYFETYEKATPDFVARVWLGDGYAGDHAFKGRTTEQAEVQIPMKEVVSKKDSSLFVSKEGTGRMYYRLGLSYAMRDTLPGALDQGFVVTRRYEALDHKEDVVQNKDGSWTIKAGARVKVVLSMMAASTRYHVALVDAIPAGLEAENPALPTSGYDAYLDAQWSEGYTWYQHQNLRDERVEAFTTYLPDGVYLYSYTAKATTPGVFLAPPAKAEEMYAPETFGRSAATMITIVE